jgi:hypothetical protein
VIHEFLLASVLRRLVMFLAQRQGLFTSAGIGANGTRVLNQLGTLRDPLVAAMFDAVAEVAPRCGMAQFHPTGADMRVWSRTNGFLEPAHAATVDERALGFVLFVHREPRRFEGGALHLRTPAEELIVEPSQNSIVFFRRAIAIQIGAVSPVSDALIDSRLTLEGWIHAEAPTAC